MQKRAQYWRIETSLGRELARAQAGAKRGRRDADDAFEGARELTLIIKPCRHCNVEQRHVGMSNLLTRKFDPPAPYVFAHSAMKVLPEGTRQVNRMHFRCPRDSAERKRFTIMRVQKFLRATEPVRPLSLRRFELTARSFYGQFQG